MATTTPNYGWPVPTSTDLVKDGATAIEALGDAIDATVFGLPAGGLTLISSTTIGTTVASVTVSSAFSATYDNYKIVVSGGVASGDTNLLLTLGSSATGYYQGIPLVNYSGGTTTTTRNNASNFQLGSAFTTGMNINYELANPFIAANTTIYNYQISFVTAGSAGAGGGFHNVATSFTAFTIASSPATLTGGTIRVYGYAK
jgi:hypothetical protein